MNLERELCEHFGALGVEEFWSILHSLKPEFQEKLRAMSMQEYLDYTIPKEAFKEKGPTEKEVFDNFFKNFHGLK